MTQKHDTTQEDIIEIEVKLSTLKENLEQMRNSWLGASFVDRIDPVSTLSHPELSQEECEAINDSARFQFKNLFQEHSSQLEDLERTYDSMKEEVKNIYREYVKTNGKDSLVSNLFSVSVRRSYEYDVEAFLEVAEDKGFSRDEFFKDPIFDPKKVSSDLEKDLEAHKRVKSNQVTIKEIKSS